MKLFFTANHSFLLDLLFWQFLPVYPAVQLQVPSTALQTPPPQLHRYLHWRPYRIVGQAVKTFAISFTKKSYTYMIGKPFKKFMRQAFTKMTIRTLQLTFVTSNAQIARRTIACSSDFVTIFIIGAITNSCAVLTPTLRWTIYIAINITLIVRIRQIIQYSSQVFMQNEKFSRSS